MGPSRNSKHTQGEARVEGRPLDWPSRGATLKTFSFLAITFLLATPGTYLGHQDRVAVGASLLLSLAFLFATVLALGFYRVRAERWLTRTTSATGIVVLGLMVGVGFATLCPPPPPWEHVRIVALDCNGDPEQVAIRNSSDKAQTMWKWKLQSEGLQEFDLSTIGQLDGGQTITLFSYTNAPDDDPTKGYYLWDHHAKFRDNDPDDYARLVSDTGVIVHTVHCLELMPTTVSRTASPTPITTASPTATATPSPTPTASPTPAHTPTPHPATPTPPAPTPEPPTPTPRTCCRICTTGKACGDTCIPREYECGQPPGCACDAH